MSTWSVALHSRSWQLDLERVTGLLQSESVDYAACKCFTINLRALLVVCPPNSGFACQLLLHARGRSAVDLLCSRCNKTPLMPYWHARAIITYSGKTIHTLTMQPRLCHQTIHVCRHIALPHIQALALPVSFNSPQALSLLSPPRLHIAPSTVSTVRTLNAQVA